MSLFINSIEVTFEAEAASETFNAKMNDDVSIFFMLNLSDSLLQVQNLTIVQSKNRFVEARERQDVKHQQEFKNSTQRELSQHEHVLRKTKQQELQQRMKQKQRRRRKRRRERGRRRGRDRGLTRARDEEQRDEEQRGEEQRGEGQRGEGQRGERAVTSPFIQTDAGLFAAFHM